MGIVSKSYCKGHEYLLGRDTKQSLLSVCIAKLVTALSPSGRKTEFLGESSGRQRAVMEKTVHLEAGGLDFTFPIYKLCDFQRVTLTLCALVSFYEI